jgi:Apea-like HEPN
MGTKSIGNRRASDAEQQLDLIAGAASGSGNAPEFGAAELGVYMRTSWMLAATEAVSYPFNICVRGFSESDGEALVARVRKRNVFARHSGDQNFYLSRIRALINKTVIEVLCPGQPDDFSSEARRSAELFECLAVLSHTCLPKQQVLDRLGIGARGAGGVEFLAGSGDYLLRSKTKRVPRAAALLVDARFDKRFRRYGFVGLYEFCASKQGLAERVRASVGWLRESRLEIQLQAAIVKTSIALEALLIFSESESLARALSERTAFMLSPQPERRECISKLIRRFYDARSGVVHGSRDKARLVSDSLLQAVDMLVIMLNLTIAANGKRWGSQEQLRDWCEKERWGAPAADIVTPFPDFFLKKALEKFSAGGADRIR